MKRSLITQMRHEWKSNLWLVVELLIVSCVVSCVMYATMLWIKPLFEPMGFDEKDVYTLTVKYVGNDSPEYVEHADQDATDYSDFMSLLVRIRRHPLVEAAAVSSNAAPYQFSYMGNNISPVGSTDSINYYGNTRYASPDLVKVYRMKGVDGTSTAELEARMRRGEIILGLSPWYDKARDTRALAGRQVFYGNDTTRALKVAAITDNIRRSAYEQNSGGMILLPIDESQPSRYWEIVIRVKPGEGRKFAEQFYANPSLQRQRNVYLTELTSLENKRVLAHRSNDQQVRTATAIMAFFLIIVFLGLLGSFWYRVQARASEIALRKVTGASRGDIMRRLLSEGSLLLLSGYILGIAISFLILYKAVDSLPRDWELITWALLLTLGIMELMVVLGIWFPARRAMRIEPAEVLKEE